MLYCIQPWLHPSQLITMSPIERGLHIRSIIKGLNSNQGIERCGITFSVFISSHLLCGCDIQYIIGQLPSLSLLAGFQGNGHLYGPTWKLFRSTESLSSTMLLPLNMHIHTLCFLPLSESHLNVSMQFQSENQHSTVDASMHFVRSPLAYIQTWLVPNLYLPRDCQKCYFCFLPPTLKENRDVVIKCFHWNKLHCVLLFYLKQYLVLYIIHTVHASSWDMKFKLIFAACSTRQIRQNLFCYFWMHIFSCFEIVAHFIFSLRILVEQAETYELKVNL